MNNFDEVYHQYWDRIFRLCMGYVNDHDLALDMAQETFVIVWKQLPTFRGEAAIGTWIYRIAVNLCLRQIEKNSREFRLKKDAPLHHHDTEPDLEPRIRLLYRLISELPELDRIIISLELETVKQSEIARITGISDSNVRVRIHRIKEKLTKKFKENGY